MERFVDAELKRLLSQLNKRDFNVQESTFSDFIQCLSSVHVDCASILKAEPSIIAIATRPPKLGSMQLGGNKKRRPRLPITPLTPQTPQPPQPPPAGTRVNVPKVPIQPDILDINEKRYEFTIGDLENKGYIGEGAFGTVSKMIFKKTSTVMAVKRIALRDLYESDIHDIQTPMIAMKEKINVCSFIINIYGYLIRDGDLWLCMELMDSSMDKISERIYKVLNKRIPEEILGMMTVAVIRGLTYLESKLSVIHRRVQLSNIFVNEVGNIKLGGLHSCDHLDRDGYNFEMDIGCRPYMAPERIDPMQAESGYTTKADVWSFGITLMELALGCFPYGKWATIFEQLNAVVNGPPPKLPEDGRFSKMMQEFASACVTKDKTARPNYRDLQQYKFFRTYYMAEVDVGMWLKTVIDDIS